jgi:hypothetical protein
MSPLTDFFAQYPEFSYDASAPVMTEFWKMCDYFGWDEDDEERKSARGSLKDAMTQQFNNIYGTDVESISAWKNLCQVLHIDPIPDELNACRNVSHYHGPIRVR